MAKVHSGEQWKTVKFDFEFTNEGRIEVSNLGRLRSFNKLSDGNILNGSTINGYRIIRLKLYKPRDEKSQKRFDQLSRQVVTLSKKIKLLQENKESKKLIKEQTVVLNELKANLSTRFKEDLKARTINYHSLVHKLVASYFLKKPTSKQTIVGHIDHDKLNNSSTNLIWMTPAENYAHQQKSPHVIAERKDRLYTRKESSKASKLTVAKVGQLKKLLNEGKPVRKLVQQFKVTDTQILRIKRGENWAEVQPAK